MGKQFWLKPFWPKTVLKLQTCFAVIRLCALLMSVAPQLIWECVKKNSSFIRKSPNCPVMSAEEGNLCGLHSFKFNGLANNKVLDVTSSKNGKKEKVTLV